MSRRTLIHHILSHPSLVKTGRLSLFNLDLPTPLTHLLDRFGRPSPESVGPGKLPFRYVLGVKLRYRSQSTLV